ncbi:hypothetical protein F4824DRAFT_363930 [Ustulina deusta]|nr:hypothetical protein F4824DRAFT_363930 [Ustulina deusta]
MKETTLDLHDFGRALLAEMNTSPFLRRARETPILLIGHSMGGLVIKKAYILAQQDPTDHFLANRIHGMFFLATPHRGSDSAKLLNKILRARSLSVLELQASLKLDLATSIRNVERSVEGLCGQLLRIDKTGTVHVIHTTVRDFLLDRGLESPLTIQKDQGHQRLALVCLQYLVSDEMRPPRNQSLVQGQTGTTPVFADYACTLFSEHVIKASAESDEILTLLYRLFRTNVLTWIEFIARHKQDLFYVIQTARNLRQYLERLVKYTSPLDDHYRFIEQWTSDLIRIVAKKILSKLTQTPVYNILSRRTTVPCRLRYIPPVKDTQSGFKLNGAGHTSWDDCVSYIDYRGIRALSLTAGENVFAIGQKTGHIKIYDSATC